MPYYFKPPFQPTPEPPTVGETKDGAGCGDHDMPYKFGSPRGFLTTRELAHLLVMRGYIMDSRHGESGTAADGDITPDSPT